MISAHNVYTACDNVSSLLARRKPVVYIGDTPDMRTCQWLVKTVVRHNFPKRGYMVFANGWLYNKSTGRIKGQNETAYLFWGPRALDVLWARYTAMRAILDSAARIPETDCVELAKLVVDEFWNRRTTYFWIHSRASAMKLLEDYVPQLGLPQLRDYGALIDGPSKLSSAA
jgi:hypothetical protein